MSTMTVMDLFTKTGFADAQRSRALLAAFQSAGLEPTAMGPEADAVPFAAEAWLRRLAEDGRTMLSGRGWYAAVTLRAGVTTVHVEGTTAPTACYALLDALVDISPPILGFVHVRRKQPPEEPTRYQAAYLLTARELAARGLRSLYPKTWFGPELVARFGKAQLAALGAIQERDGALCLDLVADPTAVDADAIERAVEAANAQVAHLGLFSEPLDPWKRRSGPSWEQLAM